MWTLTRRELEFLVSLRADWRRLYLNEIRRLLKATTPAPNPKKDDMK